MPYTKQTFAYTTGARTFTLALASGYDDASNIEVYVIGELTGGGDQIFRTFTFDSEFVINVTESIANPSSVVIQRTVSPTVFSVDFEAGDDVTKRNLQLAFRQQFFLLQEIIDGRVDNVDVVAEAANSATSAAASAVSAAASAASASSIDAAEVILRDGSIPFTDKIIGVAPTADLHLSTKKYVDDTVGGGGAMLLDGSAQMAAQMDLQDADPTQNEHATRKKYVDDLLALKAALASPALTGNPTAPTQTAGNDSTRIATTAFVEAATSIGGKLLATTVFTGSGSWVPHADATTALIFCTGGGDTGENVSPGNGGYGGGGGSTAIDFIDDTTGINSETVTIGSTAGTSSVGALASAGGASGQAAGTATAGDILIKGGKGGSSGGSGASAGAGGASYWGGEEAYGAGGQGDTNGAGKGTGKAGVVMILEW